MSFDPTVDPLLVRDHWDSRAGLGETAGSRDLIAKELEVRVLCGYLADGIRVLDAGCGNGQTALELARRFAVVVDGFDFAPAMVEAAESAAALSAAPGLRGRVRFRVADVTDASVTLGSLPAYDVVVTERLLINLGDWGSQAAALERLARLVAPGGVLVALENTQDGLDALNVLRGAAGLEAIEPPWHNRYLRDAEVAALELPGLALVRAERHSSAYYLLSRVVNAWLAAREGAEPEYDAPVNRLALLLPPIGVAGQGCVWAWRRG